MSSCKLSLAEGQLSFEMCVHSFVFFCFPRTAESDVAIKHKVKIIFQKIRHLQVSFFVLLQGCRLKPVVPTQSPTYVSSTAVQRKIPGRVDERKKGT